MRILIVSQYFHPEQFRVNDFAVGMKERGHEVVVLTGLPNYPKGTLYEGYGFFRHLTEDYQGIKVVRSWLLPRGNSGGLRLMLNYLSFAVLASFWGLFRLDGKFDVIFVHEVSPIFVGFPALVMKWRFRAPVFFWILDLWPESLTAAGNITSPAVLVPIRWTVSFIYRHCDKLLLASQAFRPSVLSFGVPPDKLHYLPNWSELPPATDGQAPPVSLPAGFKVLFAGNVGESQDFPAIIAAAEKLREYPDIKWLVVGSGRKLDWVQSEIAARGLTDTVILLGRHPIEAMSGFIGQADVMLVTLKKDPLFALTVPAKLQAYMACAKPVVTMLDGEGSRIVEEAGAGLTAGSGDSARLAENVLRLYRLPPGECRAMGQEAQRYYQRHFDRKLLFDQMEALFVRELEKPLS